MAHEHKSDRIEPVKRDVTELEGLGLKETAIVLPVLCRECGDGGVAEIYASTQPGAICCTACNGNNVGIDPDSWLGAELGVLLRNVLGICD